ncbi:MAG: lipocalin-like domain-containing protein [bacterium]|nr:lipocalin-like domain-containing protein [bacterium]
MKTWLWLISLFLLTWTPVQAGEFKQAEAGYPFSFPQDHGLHRGYKTEWWYYTGHLDGGPERYGFQFTIFKLEREGSTAFLFHCALTPPQGKFVFDERLQREFPGLAGYKNGVLWVENNRLQIEGNRHRMTSHCQGADLTLNLTHQRPPVVHGTDGISPKGTKPGNASHYYSVVDLEGTAVLDWQGQRRELKAQAWMDHEFGSNFLEPQQKGWDWVTLSLNSGLKLMLFRIRQEPGPDFLWGTWIPAQGPATAYRGFELIPQGQWTSGASKTRYPAGFLVQAPEGQLRLTPWRADQELRTPVAGMIYFEGAVEVEGQWQGQAVTGQGYLEMTGYAGKIEGKF